MDTKAVSGSPSALASSCAAYPVIRPRCSSRRTRWCTADTDRPTRSARSVKLARPSRASALSSARSTSRAAGGAPPAGGSAGEFDELTGAPVQSADAVVGANHDVLDAGAVAARQVDAGFDGEGHPRLERQVVALDDVGRLVGVQTDAVPGAVDELP